MRDDILGIELPANAMIEWKIMVGDENYVYPGTEESQFIPFDFTKLPYSVEITRSDNQWSKKFILWDDGRNNRLLAFDASGLFSGTSCLNAKEDLLVAPGDLILLTRFLPDGYQDDCIELNFDPALFRLKLTLAVGKRITLSYGSAKIQIISNSYPTMFLRGETFRGIDGNEFYASNGLILYGSIPTEFLIKDSSLCVIISASDFPNPIKKDIPVIPNQDGVFEIALGDICQSWPSRLIRLQLGLHRIGLHRSLVRLVIWLWNGLTSIADRVHFSCLQLPNNLNRENSDNIAIDDAKKTLTYRSEAKRYFHLVFDLPGKGNIRFSGAVPGVFMTLVRFQDGYARNQPLRRGAVLAIHYGSREILDIYSSQGGILTLGDFSQEIPLRSGLKRLHLSTLVHYLKQGANYLSIKNNDKEIRLLQLVTPHRVLSMKSEQKGRALQITLDLPAPAESMRCIACDVLSGIELNLDVVCNDSSARLNRSILIWLECGLREANGHYPHYLEIPLDRWESGAWLLKIEARINTCWGSLVNEREDIFAWSLLIDEEGYSASSQYWYSRLKELNSQEEVLRTFKTVHHALLSCYAPEAWDGLKWLIDAWYKLLSNQYISAGDGQILTELLALDALTAPETSQESWFPLLSIGVTIPWIYARSATSYHGLQQRAGLIGKLASIHPPLEELFLKHFIEPTFAVGFSNIKKISEEGKSPQGFSFERYRKAMEARDIESAWSLLNSESWRPAEGDYLGPVHWRFAINSLQNRYRATLSGNEMRRGWCLRLLRDMAPVTLADIATEFPAHLNNFTGLGFLTTKRIEEEQEILNILAIDRLLCLFTAICRWASRRPDTLNSWQRILKKIDLPDSNALEQALVYLLFVGRDVFEFYVLLWELVFAADADTTK